MFFNQPIIKKWRRELKISQYCSYVVCGHVNTRFDDKSQKRFTRPNITSGFVRLRTGLESGSWTSEFKTGRNKVVCTGSFWTSPRSPGFWSRFIRIRIFYCWVWIDPDPGIQRYKRGARKKQEKIFFNSCLYFTLWLRHKSSDFGPRIIWIRIWNKMFWIQIKNVKKSY